MQLKTILNRVLRHSAFVYVAERLVETLAGPMVEVQLRARANSRPRCGCCGRAGPGYDTLAQRRFEFVPLWGMRVFFLYAPRRLSCARCGVRVEALPWAVGKHQLTTAYAWFLARWAKRLSWKEVAAVFQTSWDKVFHAVEMAVDWGRAHQDLGAITAIGVDEVQWQRGHRYLTLVYQIDTRCKRLLWVGKERKVKTLLSFFRWFGAERSAGLKFVCSDMWKPYLKVIAKKAAQAVHVLDRFHIMAHLSKAIDEVRASEVKALKAGGYEPVLKDGRWLLLKRPENLSEKQEIRLAELLQYNLKTVRAYLLKEDFQFFWSYRSWYWAGQFLDRWCKRTMRSRIEPMKKVARMLRAHRLLILNWFRAKGAISSGIVEGFNNKAKLSIRKAYGFRTFHGMEIALFHALGALPEPEGTHRFC
jgi:transposase